jgi:hypothetical protein
LISCGKDIATCLAFRPMADRFDVVAIRTNDKGAVVIRMVDRADSGRTVVFTARIQSCLIKRPHLLACFRNERDMHWFLLFGMHAKPKFRFAAFAKTGPTLHLGDESDA